MTKDNIMKHTDGLFHKVFDTIAKEYPEIETNHMIIDIGSAKLAAAPDNFDVVVTLNLYGDVVSDIVAEVAGSVGLCGSSNVGKNMAMFEAIHGSAPDIAGKNIANPSGLLNGAVMMLQHLNLNNFATKIENAWLATLEDGIHTGDVYQEGISSEKVGTKEFADAVIARLGKSPKHFKAADYQLSKEPMKMFFAQRTAKKAKNLVGVDVFLDWDNADRDPNTLGKILENCNTEALKLKIITNRGVKVYPDGQEDIFKTDHWRCRFTSPENAADNQDILDLLQKISEANLDFIKTENLYFFDNQRAYSLGQGE